MPDELDEEGGSGLPPHQLDRVWFHPSELPPDPPADPRGERPGDRGAVATTRPEPARERRDWTLAAVAAICGVVATLVVVGASGVLDDDGSPPVGSSALAPGFAALAGTNHTASLVATVGASVMAVRATSATGSSTGSGIALGGDRVLTNASLVVRADILNVTTADGRVLAATVVGSDAASDLTVLRVENARVPAARLGTADDLTVGSWVLAVGAAGGERRWASQGVVSGISELVAGADGTLLPGLLGTDVDPSPTAGGGALLDERGVVVAILSRSAPGHALPIDVARDIADQLSATGRARHGWLGVAAADAVERAGGGAQILGVTSGGPAEAAGLLVGDVVSALGDNRVADVADLIATVARRRPGDPVTLTVWRGTERTHVAVKLGEQALMDASLGP
jgi:S1-C subfamily serine protease